MGLRYRLKSDWLFYLFIAAYAYSITAMTIRLWFGDGVNVFASYSDASVPAEVIVEANKVYWSKTWFLFGSLLFDGPQRRHPVGVRIGRYILGRLSDAYLQHRYAELDFHSCCWCRAGGSTNCAKGVFR